MKLLFTDQQGSCPNCQVECGLERELLLTSPLWIFLSAAKKGVLPQKTEPKGVEYGLPVATTHLELITWEAPYAPSSTERRLDYLQGKHTAHYLPGRDKHSD